MIRPIWSVLHKEKQRLAGKYKTGRLRLNMVLYPNRMSFYCPCCGIRFQSFVTGNYTELEERYNPARYKGIRQDMLCPCCGSLPRHRILALWCSEHASLLNSASILYFAPERSMMKWMKRNRVTCVTADLNHKTDLTIDIEATGLPSESYDFIFCNHVLEHVDDFRKALKEVCRILRIGGSFVCSFPMLPGIDLVDEDPLVRTGAERLVRFGQVDHQRIFGMNADQLLVEAGFVVERICGEDYPKEIMPVVGPADYDINILFHCIKQGDAERS